MHTRVDLHRAAVAIAFLAVHIASMAQNSNEFGYPIAPDLSSSINAPVGKIADEISVSQSGAASYSIGFEIPPGISASEPTIALNYNSQSGNGIAGWGCNLTGFSVITRLPGDIYHDGLASGITYDMTGPFCLDGQRLIQYGGVQGGDSVVFYPEFSPFTKVVLHGLSSSAQGQTWFSVHTPDGNDSEYGHTYSSQQRYSVQGTTKVYAWYVCSMRNPLGGQRNYSYTKWNNRIYPQAITYGNNIIRFAYEARPDTICTAVEGVSFKMTKRLSSISTATVVNGTDSLFRRYTFTYTSSDQTTTSFSRLTRVDVANRAGESLRPTILDWCVPQAFNCQKNTPYFQANFDYMGTQRESMSFIAGDFNGDGLSDIAQFGRTNSPYGSNFNYVQMHYAHINNNGYPEFLRGERTTMPEGFIISDWKWKESLPVAADVDGDGILELLAPECFFSQDGNYFGFYVYKHGQEIGGVKYFDVHVSNEKDILWTIGDYNNDGITESFVIEKQTDGTNYYGVLMGGYLETGGSHVAYNKPFRFPIPAEPKHLFTADMDLDGLADLVVFYNQGYSVIRNTGNWLSDNLPSPYIPQHTDYTLGLNPSNAWQGDFNGDNIPDFLVCQSNSGNYYFELGNGNGTLAQTIACTLDVYDQTTNKDDDYFFCQVLDIDGDGKSDIVVHKSMYTGVGPFASYDRSEVYWLRSDGKRLIVQSHAIAGDEAEGKSQYYTQGDFNGDGLPEVASYSFDCYNGTNSSGNAVFRIYRNSAYTPSKGKITGVTDGLDRQTTITYSTLANTNVRLQDAASSMPDFPVIKVSAPLHVVSSVGTDNGAAGQSTKTYRYGALLGHVQGRGLLGMNSTRTQDETTGLVTDYHVTQWHPTALVPSATTDTITQNGHTSTRKTDYYIQVRTAGNYRYFRCCPERIVSYDFDGNFSREDFSYYANWEMPYYHSVSYGSGNSEYTQIFDCVYKGGRHLPTDVGHYRHHSDDQENYMAFTLSTYNNMGLPESVTTYADTEQAVTKAYTYDNYGNRLTETVSANGVTPLVSTWQYDGSHRFVTQHTENGLTETLYTHDLWGNVLTETDNTRTAHPLTRTNTYDGWGNLTASVSPLGVRTTYTRGWGSTQAMRYYEVTQGTKQPWTKTWYDAVGREVKTESINGQGLPTATTTYYNDMGQVSSVESQTGNVTVTQSYTYDNRGRCISSSVSDTQGTLSQTRTYTYGSNWKSETFNGRTTRHTYNRWGDVVSVITPQDTVTYHYYSSRLPSSVTSCGHTVTMTYDIAGNRTSMTDPDAGTMTYTYDGLGRIKSQKDARNQQVNYTYDSYGRMQSGPVGGTPLVSNTYGTGSANKGLLLSASVGNTYQAFYTYDGYGRITAKRCQLPAEGSRTFEYTYNTDGLPATKTYPDGTVTAFQYDAYGNHVSTTIGNTVVWQLTQTTGSTSKYQLAGTFLMEETSNAMGMLTARTLKHGGSPLHGMTFAYSPSTGNLTQRTGMLPSAETFTYDALERLTQAGSLAMTYSADGNILSKTDMGQYYYEGAKPHAVTSIDNSRFLVSDAQQTVTYNGMGKATRIQGADGYNVYINFGPEGERWQGAFSHGNEQYAVLYLDDYEETIVSQQVSKSVCYLDGGVLAMRDANGTLSLYVPFTDNLGSVTRIYDSSAHEVFNASYDAWGNQTLWLNDIGFIRGYTGHEMLPQFGLINMNGRLYDPQIGRFLSTDNYVQEPYDSQNFNRYSYCLNNPLKYTDPSGEFIHLLIGAAVGGYINWMINRCQWNASGLASFATGALASVSTTNAIGGVFGHQLGSVGTEMLRAGSHGIIQGTITGLAGGNFLNGFATGSVSSLVGSGLGAIGASTDMSLMGMGLSGGLASQLTGSNFVDGFMTGFSIGAFNHKWEVLPDGTPHCILDEVCVTGRYKGVTPLMTVTRFAETINSTLSNYVIITQIGKSSGYILERGGPETTRSNQNRRIPTGVYDMDYTYSNRFKKKLYLISNSQVSKDRGIRLHVGNYYYDSTGCLLPGNSYNLNSVSNAYEVFSSGKELKKMMFLLEGNKTRLVIIDNLP